MCFEHNSPRKRTSVWKYFYFYLFKILTAFKLKIISEVIHHNLKMLKLLHYKNLIKEREAENLFHPSNSMSSYEENTHLKTNKGESEAERKRTKGQTTICKTYTYNLKSSNTNPTNIRERTHVHRKGKQFLLH